MHKRLKYRRMGKDYMQILCHFSVSTLNKDIGVHWEGPKTDVPWRLKGSYISLLGRAWSLKGEESHPQNNQLSIKEGSVVLAQWFLFFVGGKITLLKFIQHGCQILRLPSEHAHACTHTDTHTRQIWVRHRRVCLSFWLFPLIGVVF